MSRRTALLAVLAATVAVAAGLWWLHPALTVIYLGTVVQVGCLLLIPVDGGSRR